MNQQTKKGIFFAVLAAGISGISIFYNKLVIVKGIDPLIFNIIKNGGVAIILSFLIFSLPQKKDLINLSAKTWKKLFLIGIIGGSIPFILFFEGLKSTPAINATLIQKSLFIWVTAAALPLLGERLSIWQTVGFILVAASNLFIGGFTNFQFTPGELMILLATFFWTAEVIVAKITLEDTHNLLVSWARMFIGSFIMLAIAGVSGKLPLLLQVRPDQLLATSGSILLLTGYVTFWFKALKHAPANVVTSVLILATPITNILSALFITHAFVQLQFINITGTIIGVILISFFIKNPENISLLPAK